MFYVLNTEHNVQVIKVDVKGEPIQQVHEQKSQQLHSNMTCTFLCIVQSLFF